MTGCLTVCSDYRGLRAWRQLRGWDRELLPGQGDTPVCPYYYWSYRDRDVRRESAPCECSVSLPLIPGLARSVLLQCLQMGTNKGGLKQNESKQTNGIRVMGVGGLVHSDKHNDALYVCVFLCLGDYQWLGVWCVWLGDCYWVSLCVCLSVYVFVIMCVYIYSF